MIDIKTGKEMSRGNFLKGGLAAIIASGSAPWLAVSANASVGGGAMGMMRNVGGWMAARFGEKSLPYDEELEWLWSTTQYIDTGVVVNPKMGLYVKCAPMEWSDGESAAIVGAGSSSSWRMAGITTSIYYPYTLTFNQSGGTKTSVPVTNFDVFGEYVFDGYTLKAGKIGSETDLSSQIDTTWISANNIGLFSKLYNGKCVKSKIAYCIIKIEGVTVRDYIPVLISGEPCMYDRIGKTPYRNNGIGTFGYKKKDGTIVDPT